MRHMHSKPSVSKKTKIIATYGPSCEEKGVLSELLQSGTDLIRLNASHNADKALLSKIVKKIRSEAKKSGKNIGIFLDLQGPKIRVGKFKEDKTELKQGSTVKIRVDSCLGNQNEFQVDYKHFIEDVSEGDPVFIDDGRIKGVIQDKNEQYVTCKITTGGLISNHKGVNLPCSKLSMSAFTDKDEKDAITAIAIKCDYIALSFVSSAYDVTSFRDFLTRNGGGNLRIISKVERQQAVDNLVDIIKHSDAIMVARGDLGVEIGVEKVPRIQKQIIELSNKYIKPVIVATQMLESMIQSTTATRAEVSDIANAIYDHCDAVMLSAETAVGINPQNVVTVMSEICDEADRHLEDMRRNSSVVSKKIFEYDSTATSFCRAADQIAEENNATAIMAFTSSGNTPLIASKLNSVLPIIAPTDSLEICHKMSIYRGVIPIMMPKPFKDINRWTDMIHLAVKEAKGNGLLSAGDRIVVTAGIPIGKSNGINSIRIIDL
ncbi:pyruvate kinase [Candidatus Marinamargulisbacteria bacterium SCGC AG-343-D04]|nr:pyruvate kinase [Candidatus Marinamargulisbacteria bacterium SCGC AG-343-D04]